MIVKAVGVNVDELDMEATLFRDDEEEIRALHGLVLAWPVEDGPDEGERKAVGELFGWMSRSPFSPDLVAAADVLDGDAAAMAWAATHLVDTLDEGATDVILVNRVELNVEGRSEFTVDGRLELMLGPVLRVLLDTLQVDPATTVLVVCAGGLLWNRGEHMRMSADREACRAADLEPWTGDGDCWYLPHPLPRSWRPHEEGPSLLRRMRASHYDQRNNS